MMRKFYRNFILCGEIDFHCLLCAESFKETSDLDKHIRWEKHRKLMKNQTVVPKLRTDQIYKIGSHMYCLLCNFATETMDNMTLHISTENHKMNKAKPQAEPARPIVSHTWDGNSVVFYLNTVSGEEWHSVVNKQCLICATPVQDVDDHITSTSHMINLINTETKIQNDWYYRMINKDTVYCFDCKQILPFQDLPKHVSEEHDNKPDKLRKQFYIDSDGCYVYCHICQKKMENKSRLIYFHTKTHAGDISTDSKLEKARIPFVYVDRGKQRHELKEYGKNHFIKLNSGGSKGYCSICHTYISAHMNNFQEHVKGIRHKCHLECKGLVKKTSKPEKVHYRIKLFLQQFNNGSIYEHSVYFTKYQVVFLKENVCIDILSFLLLGPIPHTSQYECYLCNLTFPMSEQHCKPYSNHSLRFQKVEAVSTTKDEVIRMIRPGLYHCGYCNAVYPTSKLLELHLKSWKHFCARQDANRSLNHVLSTDTQPCREFLDFMESLSCLSINNS